MAEQADDRRVTAEVRVELISLMVPDVDPELVRLMLTRAAHRDGKREATLLRAYAELLALIRDAGIDRAQLCAILGLDPETPLTDGGNPH